MSEEEKIYANAFNQSLQLGPVKLRKIKEYFKTFKNGWAASLGELINAANTKSLKEFRDKINPEKEFETLKKEKIEVLLPNEFPKSLTETPYPPAILYIKGRLPDENQAHLAVVGTRKCTGYGKEATEKTINGLRDYNIIIVSGMAAGIDTAAHKTALKNKMPTVAVLGNGLKDSVIFPQSNLRLSQEIAENGGAVITEFPYAMPAARFTFPQRNRIVAGLSQGTAVMEAPERSGALITAFMALEYDREVFSLPGPIFSQNSRGTNNLLKLGAIPLTSADDILNAFGIETNKKENTQMFSPFEAKIIILLFEPLTRDELIQKSGMPAKEINPLLTRMEIKGIIKEIDGQFYKI